MPQNIITLLFLNYNQIRRRILPTAYSQQVRISIIFSQFHILYLYFQQASSQNVHHGMNKPIARPVI